MDPTQTHVATELTHHSPLISCRFDPQGRFVFAGAQDYQVWRWGLEGGEKTAFDADSWVRGLAFADGGETLITGGYDGRLIWWPAAAEKPEPLRIVAGHAGWIRAVAVSPNGQLLASVGNDHVVRLWTVADGKPVRELTGHEAHIYNVAFHPDGKALVSGDLMGRMIHWNVDSGEQVRGWAAESLVKYDTTFKANIGGYRGLGFSRDGKLLAGCGITNVSNAFAGVGNPCVVVVDWESGEQLIEHLSKGPLQGTAWGVALHSQGTVIAAAGGNGGYLLFWKPGEKEPFHQFKLPDTARDLDLSPDGMQLATAHFDGRLRISRMAAKPPQG